MCVHLRNNENNNRIFLCPNAVNTLIMLRHKILNGMTLKYIYNSTALDTMQWVVLKCELLQRENDIEY